jgi:recombination protein RecT
MMGKKKTYGMVVRKKLGTKKYVDELKKALPAHIGHERFIRLALTILKNPDIAKCTEDSLLIAVMESAQLGLVLDGVLGHGYLVPFWNKHIEEYEAKYILGYRGYIELALRTGKVNHVETAVVYEGDDFKYRLGTDPMIHHIPTSVIEKRGQIIAAYCVVVYKTGFKSFDVMPRAEIVAIQTRKRKDGFSPWQTDWAEMAKKCPLRRHMKTRGLSPEITHSATQEEYYDAGLGRNPKEIEADIVEREKFGDTMANGQSVEGPKHVDSESEPVPESKGAPRALKKAERQDLYIEHHKLTKLLNRKQIQLDGMEDKALIESVKMMRRLWKEEQDSKKPQETTLPGIDDEDINPDANPFHRDDE